MSDDQQRQITTYRKAVIRDPEDMLYYIHEFSISLGGWHKIGRGYVHSTSCYAKLGRIFSNQSQGL